MQTSLQAVLTVIFPHYAIFFDDEILESSKELNPFVLISNVDPFLKKTSVLYKTYADSDTSEA